MGILDGIRRKMGRKHPHAQTEAEGEQEENQLSRRLEGMEDMLRRIRNYERRQGQALESLQHEISVKLDAALREREADLPLERICDFASGFALYYQKHASSEDQSLAQIWDAFRAMLGEMGLEMILDRHVPFDSSRHNSCDVRSVPDRPDGTILEIVRPGFLLHGRLLRPADVVVNKLRSEEPAN